MATSKALTVPDTHLPRPLQELAYDRAAQAYLAQLPPEHFMEAIDQARQRAITLASLELLRARRGGLHVFNELLVQYPCPGRKKLGQVVPDNMVVLTDQPIRASGSYNVILEPAPPFWVLEYVSTSNKRKDYEDNFIKYERELKVPYYLIYYPETEDLTLYRRNHRRYATVKPNAHGRYAIPQLDLEVALVDRWVRFWHKGELLPLPDELQRQLDEMRQKLIEERQRADREKQRADAKDLETHELRRRLEELEKENRAMRERLGPA
jgi:Uma2 family endonuclease